jgi:hypothetical protein
MSVDPSRGPRYQGPPTTEYPPDGVPTTRMPTDERFEVLPNPDGSEIGPLQVSVEGQQWIEENVYRPGFVIDWGTREIIDPDTGEVRGTVPRSVPKMV